MGDGRVAGLWVKLPNGVRTPMIVRRHGRHAIELALLYEKRSHGDTSAVDRAELVKRLKSVLTAETKGVFKTYSQITEVWKAAQENAEACHQRLADQLHWHASAGRTLREGLADEKELRDIVADPAWQRMQAKRAKRSSLGFTLPHDADAVSSPRRARDDMTKVIAAKFEDTPSEDARRTAPKASPDAGTAPWPPAAAWTRRGPLRPSPANRTVLLDIMPQTKF
ncbi:hypothetical protein OVY01_13410 [Robbsia sp. Bb-Pol-6]|uniref:Uncharacterized protein n=1 Tax=Robbsia betulipollinis TaxID=2981849 RepID=A0ABT3ZNU4_9BURK|nr:hypothetical protein [Robbsia betulipollinis]MCY0388216.1 hypothetical protein [Robbsia betulipollinis]